GLLGGPRSPSKESGLYALWLVAGLSMTVNVSLAIFNLLPVPPLDGFGVVESLAPATLLPAILWLRRVGFIILIVLMITGVLNWILIPLSRLVLRLLVGLFS